MDLKERAGFLRREAGRLDTVKDTVPEKQKLEAEDEARSI